MTALINKTYFLILNVHDNIIEISYYQNKFVQFCKLKFKLGQTILFVTFKDKHLETLPLQVVNSTSSNIHFSVMGNIYIN